MVMGRFAIPIGLARWMRMRRVGVFNASQRSARRWVFSQKSGELPKTWARIRAVSAVTVRRSRQSSRGAERERVTGCLGSSTTRVAGSGDQLFPWKTPPPRKLTNHGQCVSLSLSWRCGGSRYARRWVGRWRGLGVELVPLLCGHELVVVMRCLRRIWGRRPSRRKKLNRTCSSGFCGWLG